MIIGTSQLVPKSSCILGCEVLAREEKSKQIQPKETTPGLNKKATKLNQSTTFRMESKIHRSSGKRKKIVVIDTGRLDQTRLSLASSLLVF